MKATIVILAAGKGTRFHSNKPKVLHELGGVPMLAHVLAGARAIAPEAIHVIVGEHAGAIRAAVDDDKLHWHRQSPRLGTGHALQCARSALDGDNHVLVLCGDVPLVRPSTLKALLAALDKADIAILTQMRDDPTGYGRIVRNRDNDVIDIVEQSDATPQQAGIRETNTGVIAARGRPLAALLDRIEPNNAQNEYYLTDCVGLAAKDGMKVAALPAADPGETLGINTMAQLEAAERQLQLTRVRRLQDRGVTVRDARRLDIRGEVTCGHNVCIDIDVLLEGRVTLGDDVCIGAHCILRDVSLGGGTRIEPFSLVESSRVGNACIIGPFARIRPQVELGNRVKVGNFVEIKRSTVASNSKINHLSYVGDSEVGCDTNIGAGTITCNYDGAEKHRTIIGDGVFIGSGTQLVAPVKIASGATIGAGSTITRDARADALTLSRSRQETVPGWRRPDGREKK